jgi:hypothetical protein
MQLPSQNRVKQCVNWVNAESDRVYSQLIRKEMPLYSKWTQSVKKCLSCNYIYNVIYITTVILWVDSVSMQGVSFNGDSVDAESRSRLTWFMWSLTRWWLSQRGIFTIISKPNLRILSQHAVSLHIEWVLRLHLDCACAQQNDTGPAGLFNLPVWNLKRILMYVRLAFVLCLCPVWNVKRVWMYACLAVALCFMLF